MLEEKGIGRPSTYAAIMTTIQDREYVEKAEGRFHPTPLGTTVNDVLVANFDRIFNTTYTARMEEELDEIEEGKIGWREALQEFYGTFVGELQKAETNLKNAKQQAIPTDEICEKCGSGMVIKFGRFGQFLACANYPECKTTREVSTMKSKANGAENQTSANGENQKSNGETAEETPVCELCGKDMALKKGRFGSFYGCTGYPDCKNIRKIAKSGQVEQKAPPVELDEICPNDGAKLVRRQGRFGEFVSCSNYPKCEYIKRETTGIPCTRAGCKGEIVVKKSKRGKNFYGCSVYPKCDVVFWDKPVAVPCPQCNAPFLLEKNTKQGTVHTCANENCDYKSAIESADTKTDKADEIVSVF
jgi:DNA topoisomerase-1